MSGGRPLYALDKEGVRDDCQQGVRRLSMHSDQAHRRAEALFKKEQQAHEGQQATAEYEAKLEAMREKTARLRALRLARDGAKKKPEGRRVNYAFSVGRRVYESIYRCVPCNACWRSAQAVAKCAQAVRDRVLLVNSPGKRYAPPHSIASSARGPHFWLAFARPLRKSSAFMTGTISTEASRFKNNGSTTSTI